MASGLNTSSGIGTGEAIVFDTRGSVNKYTAEIQRQANARAAEQKALQDELGKVKMDGLREADKPEYFKGFEDWRTTAQKASASRDFREKANLQSEADKKYMELNNLVAKSKEYNRLHQDVSNKFLDNNFRDQFTDDAVTQWQQSDKLPLSDPRLVKDPSTLSRQLDLSKVDDKLAKIDAGLLSKQIEANPIAGDRLSVGNRKGTNLVYKTSVDPKRQAFEYAMAYDTDKDLKHYIKTQYADLYASKPEDEAKALAIQDMVGKRPVQKQRNQFVMDEPEDKFYAHEAWKRAHPDPNSAPKSESELYRKQWIDSMVKGEPGSGEYLKSIVAAQGEYTEPLKIRKVGDVIKIGVPQKTVMSFDVDGKPKAKVIPGRVVDVNTKDPADKSKLNNLLNELTKEKISESKFQTGNASGKIKTTTPATAKPSKTVPLSKIEGLVGKKGYEGYTKKELVDYYKSQGYTIK